MCLHVLIKNLCHFLSLPHLPPLLNLHCSTQTEGDPSTKRRMEQEVYTLVEEISANLAFYCRANMTIGGEELTSHSCRIIFSPELLLRATPRGKMRGSLSLGLAVAHLSECVDNYPFLSEELQKLERKLESEAELEDSEVCVWGGHACVARVLIK